MEEITLEKVPSIFSLYKTLLLSPKPSLSDKITIPKISYSIKYKEMDPEHLYQFNKLCGTPQDQIFITYPYTLTGPLVLSLFAHPNFPVKAAGLLHLRNFIECRNAIPLDQPFSLVVESGTQRFRPQGLEFDVSSKLLSQGKCLWNCKSTFLKKAKFSFEGDATPEETTFVKLEAQESDLGFEVPKNIGKNYAKVCQDYNPIHVSTLLAKIFGYKRSIAHGMWVLTKAASLITKEQTITQLNAAFKGPTFTDSQVKVSVKNHDFNIFCEKNPRPVILAQLR